MPSRNARLLTFDDIPQKESLDMISQTPRLYSEGKTTSHELARHFNQHVRQAHFLFHACRILGWMDSEGLTKSGLEVARCNKNERLRELACDAVRKAPIIASLVERYGNSIIADPDREKIEAFLFFEVGLSPSTAKRRSSTIVTWMKYLWENSEDGN